MWRYRRTVAFFGLVVVIFVGISLASLKQPSKPLREKPVVPVIVANLVVLAAINSLAPFNLYFKVNMMHVIELRENAALAFAVFEVLTGKLVV